MIIANLATYPPRAEVLQSVVEAIAPQVDKLNVVLNQYDEIPGFFSAHDNVHPQIPDRDQKDVGKFYPDVSGAEYVFLIDDDLGFPTDFVEKSLYSLKALGPEPHVGGYHGSNYYRPEFPLSMQGWRDYRHFCANIADFRQVYPFYKELKAPAQVEQIATNAAVMRAEHLPPYEFMRDSQKFVDVRLARWCFERKIKQVCLPRAAGWLGRVRFEETIYHGFTRKNPANVTKEIWTYAFKVPRPKDAAGADFQLGD